MKYVVKTGSGAIICISDLIKNVLGIQKFIGRDTQTNRQHGERINLLYFFSKYEK
jgi:hypothetical protein